MEIAMNCKREVHKPSIDSLGSSSTLRDYVRNALHLRGARWHAVVAAAGIASVAPLALSAAFPPVVPLAQLYPDNGGDGTEGFVLTGVNAYAYAASVSSAGDINGDGIDDLVIGARGGRGIHPGI